jgi:hypothetical protein
MVIGLENIQHFHKSWLQCTKTRIIGKQGDTPQNISNCTTDSNDDEAHENSTKNGYKNHQ